MGKEKFIIINRKGRTEKSLKGNTIYFDSKGEAERYCSLLEVSGIICKAPLI